MARNEHSPYSDGREGERLAFETLISDLSSRFINLPPAKIDEEIERVQRRICEVLGVDLSALWQRTAVGGPLILTHFYSSQEGLLPPMRGMSAQEYFPWLQQEMLAGRSVAVASLEELPPAAGSDRENLRLFGVKSNLTVPLSVGDRAPVGALGFNTTRGERDWPNALVKRLQLVAQVFANALARRRADEALQESEARLALAADSAEAGLWVLDYASHIFWVTERTRAIFGFAPDEVVTLERLKSCVHPDDWERVREAIEATAADSADLPSLTRVEYRIVNATGEIRWLASQGRPHRDAAGVPDRLTGVTIDVTALRRTEDALLTSQARLQAAAELAGLGFYEVSFDAGAAYVDDRFRELCGLPAELDQGLQPLEFWMEHVHPDDTGRVLDMRNQLHHGAIESAGVEYRFLHPVDGEKWLQHLARVAERDAAGNTLVAYGVLRDITQQRRSEDELRDLSRRLLQAQEEERAMLARELHDDVSQRLAVLAIDVGRAEFAAAGDVHVMELQAVREGLVRLSEDIHSLAYQLHPSVLEELGLADALRAECERRRRQGRLNVSVEIDAMPAIVSKDAALCLFRVAQEALTNVARHAGAHAATVKLRATDGGLLLAVADDGCGFNPDNPGKEGRLGLVSMRERVQLTGGTFEIESAPGQGTAVVAWVPPVSMEDEAR